jgi:hypothetical protein
MTSKWLTRAGNDARINFGGKNLLQKTEKYNTVKTGLDFRETDKLQVDGTGSGSCPAIGFFISRRCKPSGSAPTALGTVTLS